MFEETDSPDESQIQVDDKFRVKDSDSANWVVRRIAEARRYIDRVEEWGAAEVRRAENEERWLLTRFGGELQDWTRRELAATRNRHRSLKLPAGQVGFRMTPRGLAIIDEPRLARWCRESLPNALRLRAEGRGKSACLLLDLIGDNRPQLDVHEGVIVTEVKRLFEVTGELPPGAALAEPEECFYVR